MEYQLTEQDNKIRKYWPIACGLRLFIFLAAVIWTLFTQRDQIEDPSILYSTLFIFVSIFSLMTFALYYFPYKKHGTKLLMSIMIVAPLQLLTGIIQVTKSPIDLMSIVEYVIDV